MAAEPQEQESALASVSEDDARDGSFFSGQRQTLGPICASDEGVAIKVRPMLESEKLRPSPIVPEAANQDEATVPARCVAKRIGTITEFVECLVHPTPQCAFGFSYGYGYYCRHPKREEIAARTSSGNRGI